MCACMFQQTPIRIRRDHQDTIRALAFSPDGSILASLSILHDNRVILWDTTSWLPISQFDSGPGTIDLWFGPDGSAVFGTGTECFVRQYDLSTGHVQMLPTPGPLRGSVRFSAGGVPYLVRCHKDKVTFYDLETHQVQREFVPPHSFSPILLHCGWLNHEATRLAIEDHDHAIQLWDITHEQITTRLTGHHASICDMDFHPHAPLLASVSRDGTIAIWNLHDGTLNTTYYSSAPDIFGIWFNPIMPLLAVVNLNEYIEVWDTVSGKLHSTLSGHDSQIVAAFSPDGRFLVSGGDDCLLRVWQM